jgi:hypothetical protein
MIKLKCFIKEMLSFIKDIVLIDIILFNNYLIFLKIMVVLFIFKVFLFKYEEDEIDREDDGGPVYYYDNDKHLMMISTSSNNI